jgi:hypothetical protein
MWLHRGFLKKLASRRKEWFGSGILSEENGETTVYTAFSGKNGKNQKY